MIHADSTDALLFEGARVIDPFVGRDEEANLAVVGGKVVEQVPSGARVFDARGCVICPGLMDMHVHLREPGQTHKESIETGTAAAAAGGFTGVVCMPNTSPPLDHPDLIRSVIRQASEVGYCGVGPTATITQGRAGHTVVDMAALRDAGAVAFTDDGSGVERDDVMLSAFESAASLGVVLIQHCEYAAISDGGVMHDGSVSARLGLPGLDPRSEEAMIERDIDLCRRTGGRYHVAHISTARAVELVRRAKSEGLPVTAEVCTHHLVLTDEACGEADPNTKMHPPLRPADDVEACRRGLLDGTVDCVVTDHAPHAPEEKAVGFLKAPPGIIGLETAISLALRAMGSADLSRLVTWFSQGPLGVLGLEGRPLLSDGLANLTIISPETTWVSDPSGFESRSRNTPFVGEMTGMAVGTCWQGRWLCSDRARRFWADRAV